MREGAHARGQNSEPLKPPAKPAPTPVNRFADGSVRSVGRGGGVILVRLPCANQVVPWLKAQRFRFNPADRTWSAPDSPELAAAVAAIMPARSFGRGWSPEQPKQVNLFGAKVVELRQPAGTSATPAPKPAPSPLPPREQDEEARAILELVEAQISNPSLFDRVFGSVTSAHVAGGVLGLTFANEVGQLVARATFTPLVTACASAVLGQLNARVEFHYAEPAAAQRSA